MGYCIGIGFASRYTLKQLMRPPSGYNAHHIIPWAKRTHPVAQAAAKVGWHTSHTSNGINILAEYHLSTNNSYDAHPAYDAMIESRLTNWGNGYLLNGLPIPRLAAYTKLQEITQAVRAAIAANPTIHINDITID